MVRSVVLCSGFCFVLSRRPPILTRTAALFPNPTLSRSSLFDVRCRPARQSRAEDSQQESLAEIQPPHVGIRHQFLRRAKSDEHPSELQSLMRTSYAVFCLKKKKNEVNPSTYYLQLNMSSESLVTSTTSTQSNNLNN